MMQNLMVVEVRYSNSYLTMSTGRFTYSNFDDTNVVDKVRLTKNRYKYDRYIEQAVDYLTEHGQNVIGTDDTKDGISYIIVAPTDHVFKSISGKHEQNMDEV